MKKKLYSRPVCVMLSNELFQQIFEITEKEEISISEFIREAVLRKLEVNQERRD